MEKFVKMTNPNYKISPTRVLLKCVSKELSEAQLRTWVYAQFEGTLKPKKLRTIKLLKDVKVAAEDGQADVAGMTVGELLDRVDELLAGLRLRAPHRYHA